jgi:hypothetical protein
MLRAAMARSQLGNAFPQMVAFVIQWAALRPLQVQQDDPSLAEERERFLAQKRALLKGFVDGSSSSVAADLAKLNTEARARYDAIHEKRFPGSSARQRRHRRGSGRTRSREVLYPERLGLHPYVMKAAFSWLDVRLAQTPADRLTWLGFVRQILGIVLQSLPTVDTPLTEEIDGLPSDFDDWAFKLTARTIPCLTSAESPEVLWQPILGRGASAHKWVERFFWHWFTDGLVGSSSPVDFVRTWRKMILYALEHPAWNPANAIAHELDGIVVELLCFDTSWNAIVRTEENAQIIGKIEDIFERAIQRWGSRPKIISGLVMFAIQPGARRILLPALRWASQAAKSFQSYDWRYGLEENMIEFLHTCWQQEGTRIAREDSLRALFLAVLATLVARGSHAAIELNARVIGSIDNLWR